jgi:hypothetical protein
MNQIPDVLKDVKLGSTVTFHLTTNPLIPKHVKKGVLVKKCRVNGWQTVLERGKGKKPYFYPVQIAEIRTNSGEVVRVDAQGILSHD